MTNNSNGSLQKFQILEKQMELMQTPYDIASKIIDYIKPQILESDEVLEPFKGYGNIYNQIPNQYKSFCSTDDGIDFFEYNKQVDWAITNPPFQILENGQPINAFIKIIERLMWVCRRGFFLLINHKLWSSLTVKRLKDWSNDSWVISKIKIFEIKQWYGRYYLVKFEKNGRSLLDF